MTYQEATEYLFSQLPMFQSLGPGAYKPGLETSRRLDDLTGNPHRQFVSVHIAGTNGKGSTAHSLAAAAMASGLKTGLYTSPHLLDFRERIRVNGRMIPEQRVIDFVERFKDKIPDLSPSFFEMTTAMAFEHFAREGVDIAIIEVGLGGRLDSTNIITPALSIITNISLDHTALLGNTPAEIAREKAGIIKPGVPVVIGEADDPDVKRVFESKAHECGSQIFFAEPAECFRSVTRQGNKMIYDTITDGIVECDLTGDYQPRNMATVLTALRHFPEGMIDLQASLQALSNVSGMTGLAGRWMTLENNPLTIADTGHNDGGWQYLAHQIDSSATGVKRLVIGFVNDKDVKPIFERIAGITNRKVYFTSPGVKRGLPAEILREKAMAFGVDGDIAGNVEEAYEKARAESGTGDMIFVGGSTFVVADLLAYFKRRR